MDISAASVPMGHDIDGLLIPLVTGEIVALLSQISLGMTFSINFFLR